MSHIYIINLKLSSYRKNKAYLSVPMWAQVIVRKNIYIYIYLI